MTKTQLTRSFTAALAAHGIDNVGLAQELAAIACPPKRSREERAAEEQELMDILHAFADAAGLPMPEPQTPGQWAAFNKRWLEPAKELRHLANGGSCELAVSAVRRMRGHLPPLTVSSPQSILSVAISIYGERAPRRQAAEFDPFAVLKVSGENG